MEEEISALLTKGAVEQVHEDTRGFYSYLFLVPKKERGGETGDQPETVEQVHTEGAFPYDRSIRQGDWIIMIDRMHGCIPTRPYAQGLSQVSTICLGKENIPVSQTPILSDVISTSIHRHHDAPDGILQNQRHQSNI